MRIAIVWGSTNGNTETAAETLQKRLGTEVEAVHNVADLSAGEMHAYDGLLIGASTWDIGELQYDWADKLPDLLEFDWSGKVVGFFGCGDAAGYPDTFVDAFGILWEVLGERGAHLVGKWPVDGYEFEDSRSLCDGGKRFLGLPLDDDNEPELTDERIEAWAGQLDRELAELSAEAAR